MHVYLIFMQTFSGPIRPSLSGQPWPLGRRFLKFIPLIDPEKVGKKLCGCGPILKQKMLLLWGKQTKDLICSETWLMEFDAESYSWIQVRSSMSLFKKCRTMCMCC